MVVGYGMARKETRCGSDIGELRRQRLVSGCRSSPLDTGQILGVASGC